MRRAGNEGKRAQLFQENWSGSITSTGHQGAGSQRFIQTHIFIRVNSGKAVIPIQVGGLIRTHTGSPEATRRRLWRPAGDVDQRARTHERSLHGLRNRRDGSVEAVCSQDYRSAAQPASSRAAATTRAVLIDPALL